MNTPPCIYTYIDCNKECCDLSQARISDAGGSWDINENILLDDRDSTLTVTTGGNDDKEEFSINHLDVRVNSVVRFEPAYWGESPNLYISYLNIYNDSVLVVNLDALGNFYFNTSSNGLSVYDIQRHNAIDTGDGILKKPEWRVGAGWKYISGWSGIWTPIPEASTYGAVLGAVGLVVVAFHKRRRQLSGS